MIHDPHAVSSLRDVIARLEFRQAVLLLPVATVLHVADEWPGFPVWARQFASPRHSDREYLRTHAAAVGIAATAAAVTWWIPGHLAAWLLVAFVVGPAFFWNTWFHVLASLGSRRHCPGVVSGLLVYLPLCLLLFVRIIDEGLLSPAGLGAALLFALVFHVAEAGHNVFARW